MILSKASEQRFRNVVTCTHYIYIKRGQSSKGRINIAREDSSPSLDPENCIGSQALECENK